MAGHSHWSKIKRAKGATDAKRGKVWSKIARKIIIAAKNGGDPRDNLSLRYTIDEAKAANMPKDTIEKAILKGTGELGGENYEAVTYEGYGPGGVAIMIEALTNNRARTAPEMRSIFERHGGNLATSGVGRVPVHQAGRSSPSSPTPSTKTRCWRPPWTPAPRTCENEGEVFEVITTPDAFLKVKDAIAAAKIPIEAARSPTSRTTPSPWTPRPRRSS